MSNLIERYVYDVTRRLPEKERDEVTKELRSNIYDMLPDNAEESDMEAVLYGLGSPAALAEKYRQQPRYLISPAVYEDYIRLLKWILPLVGVVVTLVGLVLGGIEAVKDGLGFTVSWPSGIIAKGLSMGVEAAIQALIWVTVVFAIIERTGAKKGGSAAWKISDLPDTLPVDKNTIPLADSIAELVLILIFCGFAMLLCSGLIPFSFIINNGSTKVMHFFNPSFLAACLPVLALVGLLGSGATIVKIRYRRWTPMVCGAVLADSLLSMAAMIYLINRPDMLSMELAGFLQSVNPTLLNIGGNNITPTVTILLSIIIAATALGECAKAVYRTYKSGGQRPKHKSSC